MVDGAVGAARAVDKLFELNGESRLAGLLLEHKFAEATLGFLNERVVFLKRE